MLSREERNLLALIDAEKMIEFLKTLISVNSENPPGNEKEIGSLISKKLQEIGFSIELQQVESDRANVIGTIQGEQEEKILFHTHMDTVKIGNIGDWQYDPLGAETREGMIYGRGSSDMKSGIAAAIFALEALLKSGINLKKGIMFTGVVDEEVSFKGTKKLLESNKLKGCRTAYVCEPSSLEIMITMKGGIEFSARAFGKSVQSGMAFLGDNAIFKMGKVIRALEEYNDRLKKKMDLPGLRFPTVNLGTIKGGSGITFVPDFCEIEFDRQVLPGEDLAEARNEVFQLISQVERENGIKIDLREEQSFNTWTVDKEEKVVKEIAASYYDLFNKEPVYSGVNGYCEAELLAGHGIPSVVFGPGDLVAAHTPNEGVLVRNVIEAAKVYALTALRSVR